MTATPQRMAKDLDERDRKVLGAFDEMRANPYLLRERTELDKGEINTVLNRLARGGYVEQVTHGLYLRTDRGRAEVEDPRKSDR